MTRKQFLNELWGSIGAATGSTWHSALISNYNSIEPLPRGYKLRENDPWCAGYVSAMWWYFMQNRPFPYECSCTMMVKKCKEMGIWIEDDSIHPEPGWLIFYDWDDDGNGDCLGGPDHVGYVWQISGDIITTIEGNIGGRVSTSTITVNDKYIRGYAKLEYEESEVDLAREYMLSRNLMRGDGTDNYWTTPPTREQLAVILCRFRKYMDS